MKTNKSKSAGLSPAEIKKIMKEHDLDSELLVVEDRRALNEAERKGEITPEEKQAIFGTKVRNGEMLNTEDGKKYLEIFGKPEFFLGASDGPVVAGHSRWTSPLFRQYEKLGQVSETLVPAKEWIFYLGNIAEDFVATVGTTQLREKGIMDVISEDCEFGYIWIKYPHTLIHPDRFLIDRKTGVLKCLAEIKTANKDAPHWSEDFLEGRVPEDYEDQCIIMMEVLSAGGMEINECWVLVWNKTGDEDGFDQLVVKRDTKRAIELLELNEKFYADTVAGRFWEDCELKPEEVALLYKEEDKSLGYVELPKKCEHLINQLEKIIEEENALKEEIAEPLKELDEARKRKKLVKAQLYKEIGKAPGGTMSIGTRTYNFKVQRSYSLDKEVKEWAERNEDENIRKAFEAMKEVKPLISMRCTVTDAADGTSVVSEVE